MEGFILLILGIPFFFSDFTEVLVNLQNQIRGSKTEITPVTYMSYRLIGGIFVITGLVLILQSFFLTK